MLPQSLTCLRVCYVYNMLCVTITAGFLPGGHQLLYTVHVRESIHQPVSQLIGQPSNLVPRSGHWCTLSTSGTRRLPIIKPQSHLVGMLHHHGVGVRSEVDAMLRHLHQENSGGLLGKSAHEKTKIIAFSVGDPVLLSARSTFHCEHHLGTVSSTESP